MPESGRTPTPGEKFTPDGSVLTPEGVVRGGEEPAAGGGLISRVREVRELQAEVGRLDAALEQAQDTATSSAKKATESKLNSLLEGVHE